MKTIDRIIQFIKQEISSNCADISNSENDIFVTIIKDDFVIKLITRSDDIIYNYRWFKDLREDNLFYIYDNLDNIFYVECKDYKDLYGFIKSYLDKREQIDREQCMKKLNKNLDRYL